MKAVICLLAVVALLPGTVRAQDFNNLGGTPPTGGTVTTEPPVNGGQGTASQGAQVKITARNQISVDQILDHVAQGGDKPPVVNNYYRTTYLPNRATTTAKKADKPEEGNKKMPNPTVPKNPNVDGMLKVDPNTFPEGNGSFTYSAGADGSVYAHRDSGNTGFGQGAWIIVALLVFALIVAAIVAMVRGNGGGGTVINNNVGGQTPPPTPAPTPVAQTTGNGGLPAPFAPPGPGNPGGDAGSAGNQTPGWIQNAPVYLVQAMPTGSPAQEPKPQPINIHNHIHLGKPEQSAPQKPPQPKKAPAKKPETEEK